MRPFITLRERPAIDQESAIELAKREVLRRRPDTRFQLVEAIQSVQEPTPESEGEERQVRVVWNVSENAIPGGGWQMTIDAQTGAVLFWHFFDRR